MEMEGWEETDTRRSSFINSRNIIDIWILHIRQTLSGMSNMIFCNRLYYFQWNKNQNLFYTSCVYHLSKLPASLCLSSGDFELWTWKCPPRSRARHQTGLRIKLSKLAARGGESVADLGLQISGEWEESCTLHLNFDNFQTNYLWFYLNEEEERQQISGYPTTANPEL